MEEIEKKLLKTQDLQIIQYTKVFLRVRSNKVMIYSNSKVK